MRLSGVRVPFGDAFEKPPNIERYRGASWSQGWRLGLRAFPPRVGIDSKRIRFHLFQSHKNEIIARLKRVSGNLNLKNRDARKKVTLQKCDHAPGHNDHTPNGLSLGDEVIVPAGHIFEGCTFSKDDIHFR